MTSTSSKDIWVCKLHAPFCKALPFRMTVFGPKQPRASSGVTSRIVVVPICALNLIVAVL